MAHMVSHHGIQEKRCPKGPHPKTQQLRTRDRLITRAGMLGEAEKKRIEKGEESRSGGAVRKGQQNTNSKSRHITLRSKSCEEFRETQVQKWDPS